MREVKVQVKSCVTRYESVDGTQFTTKEECCKYEESAKGVLMGKYSHLIIKKSIPESDLFVGAGSDEYCYDVVKLEKETDMDVIMQLTFLDNPYLLKIENSERACAMRNRVETACEKSQPLFIGRGYNGEECFWPMFTQIQLLSNICSYCDEDKITEETEG